MAEVKVVPTYEMDVEQAVKHMEEVLKHLGMKSGTHVDHHEHYEGTARRFVGYLTEFLQPFDPGDTLKTFKSEDSGLIIEDGIPYRQVCAHHLVPAFGYTAIGYLPAGKIVGLSKLARIVDQVCTSRPSVQETICNTVADLVHEYLDAKGTIVVVRAEHGCIACRGVASPGIGTTTSAVRGYMRDVPHLRQEFMSLIKLQGVRSR